MTESSKPRTPKRSMGKHRPYDERALVVSSGEGVFEHVADDLEDDETDSVYLRDVQHD